MSGPISESTVDAGATPPAPTNRPAAPSGGERLVAADRQHVTNAEPQAPASGPSGRSLGRGGRLAATTAGGTLLVLGLRRRSLGGVTAAVAGGWLLYRGLVSSRADSDAEGTRPAGEADQADAAGRVETTRSVTVGAPPETVSERWRDPETMARLYGGLLEVSARSEDRWHWTASGPLGTSVSWDTRVVEDRPGERLRWESLGNAPVDSAGSVRFREAPAGRGTEVTFRFRFEPPGGAVGAAVTDRLGVVPESLAGVVLDRFKSLVETGEIPSLESNPSARGAGDAL
ncbi:hypothetical protein HTG_14935 [Natrinema mahii]|nr:hypothetical protein HTG_14935 [Natrinema mahii]